MRWDSLTPQLISYFVVGSGPITAAVSQFLLSLAVLHSMEPAEFGLYSFVFVIIQLLQGVSTALFCAPLPATLALTTRQDQEAVFQTFLTANIAFSVTSGLILFTGVMLATSFSASISFGVGCVLLQIRWYFRAYFYTLNKPMRTVISDLLYSFFVATGAFAVHALISAPQVEHAAYVILVSGLMSVVPLLQGVNWPKSWRQPRLAVLGYAQVWRASSRWSLLGVVTTEITSNIQSYAVMILFGSPSFSLIAACSLLVRPSFVVMNAIGDYERPRLAAMLVSSHVHLYLRTLTLLRIFLVVVGVVNFGAAASVLVYLPGLAIPTYYSLAEVVLCSSLWGVVVCVRLLRLPDSIVLQSAGAFRSLALSSVFSAAFSLIGVFAMLRYGPAWSLLGVVIGEVAFAVATRILSKRFLVGLRQELCREKMREALGVGT